MYHFANLLHLSPKCDQLQRDLRKARMLYPGQPATPSPGVTMREALILAHNHDAGLCKACI